MARHCINAAALLARLYVAGSRLYSPQQPSKCRAVTVNHPPPHPEVFIYSSIDVRAEPNRSTVRLVTVVCRNLGVIMPDAGTSTEPTPEERRAAAVERMVIATNKLKAAVLATREAEDREAAAAAKVAKIEAATSLSRAAIVAEEQLQSADGASNHEGAAEALHGDAGIFEADTVSSMDIEAFKEHLRKQMSDNMGGLFISAEAPPKLELGPLQYESPPPHPAPSPQRVWSPRARASSPRRQASPPAGWRPTGRLWGRNHPCLAPPGGSPRTAMESSRPSVHMRFQPTTPRTSGKGQTSTYVAEATIEKLLHKW